MALSVLDGNQTATTISSVVTGGEHIVAHSVVSLGTTAISNISTAVSGVNNAVGTDGGTPASTKFIKIGGHQDGQNQVEHIVHVSAGGAMKVDASDSSVTFGLASVTFSAVSISNFPATQTIAGTVTANVIGWDGSNNEPLRIGGYSIGGGDSARLALEVVGVNGNPLSISGTVTVGGFSSVSVGSGAILAAGLRSGTITPIPLDAGSGRVAGSAVVQYNVGGPTPYQDVTSSFPLPVQVVSQGSVTIGSLPAISGTVTVGAMPNGALTTRFGTPTTANTAFATSAVTNASRKYLLIQNVTTGSNVITVGIGFTPTTTQGIQLTAGAGITFESSYIPTGAVMILSSVTASNYTILEA